MSEKENSRWCCRIFPLVLILVSAIIAAAIWYFSENRMQLTFLYHWREFVRFVGSVLFVAVLPIGLFYYLNDVEKFKKKAKLLALLGFIPALLYLVFIIA